MDEDKNTQALVPRTDRSLASTAAGGRILSAMIGETLALARDSEDGKVDQSYLNLKEQYSGESDVEAILRLARINGGESDHEPNYEEEFRLYVKAAELGSPYAQYCVGLGYMDGRGVLKDEVEALRWFLKCAQQKPPGSTGAQHAVGKCYNAGLGAPQDFREAVQWFQKAAEQGLAVAQCDLAESYRLGRGTPRDFNEAANWYEKAAEQGHAAAQNNIGNCYKRGIGVLKDMLQAYKWFQLAADQGIEIAKDEATAFAALMSPSELESAYTLYREFKDKHPAKQ